MAIIYEKLNKWEKLAIDKTIALQCYIFNIADIKYQCYYEKITFSQFWEKYGYNINLSYKDL